MFACVRVYVCVYGQPTAANPNLSKATAAIDSTITTTANAAPSNAAAFTATIPKPSTPVRVFLSMLLLLCMYVRVCAYRIKPLCACVSARYYTQPCMQHPITNTFSSR